MKKGLDVLGGDYAPKSNILGANEAKNIFRKDEIKRFEDVDSLLENAPTQDQHMFKLPKVLN